MAFNIRTIATTLLLPFAVAASSHADSEEAQRSDFQFSVSGALAGRLEPNTRIFIWNPMPATKPKWLDFSVDDLPVTVP